MRAPSLMLAAAALALLGCSTSTRITSEPPGALVYINDVPRGRTPLTTELQWWNWTPPYKLRLELAGYKTVEAPLDSQGYTGHIVCDVLFCFPLLWVNTHGPVEAAHYALPPAAAQ